MSISLDTRQLDVKLRNVEKAIRDKVMVKSINDSLVQIRNRAERHIKQSLNLPASRVKSEIKVYKASRGRIRGEIRGTYHQIGAQSFIGWRWTDRNRRLGLKIVRTAKDQVGKVSAIGKGKAGLSVKFRKGKPAMRFTTAFPLRGSFYRRVIPSTRKSRGAWGLNMPLVRIVGPSVHGDFEDWVKKRGAEFIAIYTRRADHWIGEEIRRKYR